MFTLLMTFSVVIAVVLVIVVLLQSSKGGGLAGSFGGVGQFGTVFGTRRTADFLSKSTWWLGGTLIVLAVVINLFFLPGTTAQGEESIIQGGAQQAVPTAPALPQQRAPQAPVK
ncbi:MAG: preprotein translocase subunit SecG [Ignavibacteria bacterium]|nr:MAG: preprotein translocase subunit SecG [Ignavibacteria bacterium]KAF0158891.1 MAG: preprotein translocase subunit SecG [Ignavibacteria bacterium]